MQTERPSPPSCRDCPRPCAALAWSSPVAMLRWHPTSRSRWTYLNRTGRPPINSAITARQPLRTHRAAHRVLRASGTDPLSLGSSASQKLGAVHHNKTDDDSTKVVLHL